MFGFKPGSASRRGKAQVLVVDDDDDTLLVVAHQLSALGAIATTANTAQEALALLQKRRFDALVADLHLEDGESSSVLWWALLNGLPTAVLTASPERADSWLSEESIAVMSKPAAADDFEKLLRRAGFAPASAEGTAEWEPGI